MSFWNDLLRNEDGVTYFSETAGRKSITDWLFPALQRNLPYDQFVSKLLNPTHAADPEGFLVGVNWRGETSAAVTPWMQAAQNTRAGLSRHQPEVQCLPRQLRQQVEAEGRVCAGRVLRAGAEAAAVPMRRGAQSATPSRASCFRSSRAAPASDIAGRSSRRRGGDLHRSAHGAAAAHAGQPHLARGCSGDGIVANPDEMDGVPWSPEVLDWLASDFVEHGTTSSA